MSGRCKKPTGSIRFGSHTQRLSAWDTNAAEPHHRLKDADLEDENAEGIKANEESHGRDDTCEEAIAGETKRRQRQRAQFSPEIALRNSLAPARRRPTRR